MGNREWKRVHERERSDNKQAVATKSPHTDTKRSTNIQFSVPALGIFALLSLIEISSFLLPLFPFPLNSRSYPLSTVTLHPPTQLTTTSAQTFRRQKTQWDLSFPLHWSFLPSE